MNLPIFRDLESARIADLEVGRIRIAGAGNEVRPRPDVVERLGLEPWDAGYRLSPEGRLDEVFKDLATTPEDGLEDLEYILSDDSKDRYGEVIVAEGWKLANFRKNPIMLFAHDSRLPIGTWKSVRVDGGRLIGKADFADAGTSDRIDEIRSLIRQKILRTVSVGFRPIKMEPMDPKAGPDDWWLPQRYLESELLEASIVSVPANPNAVQLALEMGISERTIQRVFGVSAPRGALVQRSATPGVPAVITEPRRTKMTLSQRIEAMRARLVEARARLAEMTEAEDLDMKAIAETRKAVSDGQAMLDELVAAEAEIAERADPASNLPALRTAPVAPTAPATPAVQLRQRDRLRQKATPFDMLVRSAVVHSCMKATGQSAERILDERYPGDEDTYLVTKADQTIATTGVSGWASQLVRTAYGEFMDALRGTWIFPTLRDASVQVSFGPQGGTISYASLTAGGAGGTFVGEGQPIRVGRITTAPGSISPKKMGVIIPWSRELAKYSNPDIENVVRNAIIGDTGKGLDQVFVDATAGDTIRPAGILYGVTAVGTGYGGGDFEAVRQDISNLIAPFDAADAGRQLFLLMSSASKRRLGLMPGPDGTLGWANGLTTDFRFLASTYLTANRLIAIDAADLVTAGGGAPEFDLSDSAVVHMEDTTPLEIVSGTGPTTADPVRSFWQTATQGIRMLLDVSWGMRRSGMVQYVDGTSW